MPPDTERLTAMFNDIRNVTRLPQLPRLHTLELSMNDMELFSWGCLRGFPALTYLFLRGNRLQSVQLDIVIEYLPHLKYVDLRGNRLTSVSPTQLGWPQVTTALILRNPFHCDCDLSWLIDKMACLHACQGRGREACCLSCSACYLTDNQKHDGLSCSLPTHLRQLPLSQMTSPISVHHLNHGHLVVQENEHYRMEPNTATDEEGLQDDHPTATDENPASAPTLNSTHRRTLEEGCKIKKLDPPTPATTFKCSFLGLTAIPDDIPPNVDRVELTYNAIRTVTSLPPLPQVFSLDLSLNSIESFAWESLCNLPALEVLYLHDNRLQHVKLNTVIGYLPKLRYVYLAENKLVSCSLYEIGWPQITSVSMHGNPALCDCFLDYGLTGKPCMERGVDARCSLCSACFFLSGQKRADLYCKSPDKAKQLPSSNASAQLAECDRRQSMTTRATTTKVGMLIPGEAQRTLRSSETDTSQTTGGELKPLQPTARAITTAIAPVMMDTDKAMTNNLQTAHERDTLLTKGSYHGTTPTTKASYNKHVLAAVPATATHVGLCSSTGLKTPDDQELPIGHILIVVLESALTLISIICLARLFLMRHGAGCSRRKDVNINRDQSIPLHQISQPIANYTVSSTPEGGVDPGHLAVRNDDHHCIASVHNAVLNNVQHHMSGHNAVPNDGQHCVASGHNVVLNNVQHCMAPGHNAVPNNVQHHMSGHNAVPNNDQHCMASGHNAVQDNDHHRMAPAYNAVPNNDPQCMAPTTYNAVPNDDQQCMGSEYGRPSARAVPCRLYAPPEVNSANNSTYVRET
ncbi:SLIT1 [Branchiostoma lanceolatum]|uniref:SLIT1 protein n=1 Tax=Branchiostoma lanceolatum TaxID=7740 RepID=A0A8J9Z8J8_BRALA|nr:SLIT1 [Branchiostoma lanceolatum]